MNWLLVILGILAAFIVIELLVRCIYYSRKTELALPQKIMMVLFGRWLINEYTVSSLYLDEIAGSLGVDREYLVTILSGSSGRPAEEIRQSFTGSSGKKEEYELEPMTGFLPDPSQDLGHMHTNRSGFRSPERPATKGNGVRRVILLGGSVAFGRTATSDEATIAYQLEDMLNKSEKPAAAVRWEVINLSVPDFITYQEFSYLTKTGLQLEPDIVISLSGYNDAHHYLATGAVNSPASMRGVRGAYHAVYGSSLRRIIAFLGTFSVAAQFAGTVVRANDVDEEELSPFIYTIW